MPWTCEACQQVVADDSICPSCASSKSSWTVVPEVTRQFQVRLGGFEVLAGSDEAPAPDPAALRAAPLEETDQARAVHASWARHYAERGLLPPPAFVLSVRVKARESQPPVKLSLDFNQGAVELEHPARDVDEEGRALGRFLFVYGVPGDPALLTEVSFPEIQLVDVSDGPDEHALEVEVSALGKRPRELPFEPVEPKPLAEWVELEDVHFATAHEIFLPDGEVPQPTQEGAEPAESLTGLDAIRVVLEAAALFPSKQLLVVGHTDTVGSDSSNRELAEERARNVHLYLTGQREAWAEHCQAHYERSDFKRVLAWVAARFGWDLDPGPIDDSWHDTPREARDRFRERYNAEFGGEIVRHAKQQPADWAAYYDFYELDLATRLGVAGEGTLAERLAAEAPRLAQYRAALRHTEPATLGCGEEWPVERAGEDGVDSAANRRVEMIFFDEDELPALDAKPLGVSIYGPDEPYRRQLIPADGADLLGLRLVDPAGGPPPEEVFVGMLAGLRAVVRRGAAGTFAWRMGDETELLVEEGADATLRGAQEADTVPVSVEFTSTLGKTYKREHQVRVLPVEFRVAFEVDPADPRLEETRVILRSAQDDAYEHSVMLSDLSASEPLELAGGHLRVVRFPAVQPGRRYHCYLDQGVSVTAQQAPNGIYYLLQNYLVRPETVPQEQA